MSEGPPLPTRKESRKPSRLPRLASSDRIEPNIHDVLVQDSSPEEMKVQSNENNGGGLPKGTKSSGGPYRPKGVLAAQRRARRERDADLPVFKSGMELLTEDPEMVISENVRFKGDLNFQRLVRVDGTVTGHV